ncbi:zinc transporter [Rhodophyticola sp. CCM32]|uniref:zinc ABC transporter substrate-binding protein n=1 Tax=Rhodophyticola sp. CCM32 TaxID=2916397 RepID=UPI00107F0006|nr:zinc ABC transporter substrate-binding protein [Rhodophyticola sp. CCM32]QBY00478.1 zinc transporter [Rhodophyticola sp. CCM32]
MRKLLVYGTVSTLALTAAAAAEVPSVAVDIPPVHSLVATVMEGVGTPDLILQPGASPHGYSLRPSDAQALQNADIVFWVSESLTPFLTGPINALTENAEAIELIETEGTTRLAFREGATFEAHDHGDEDHHDEDAHEDHAHEDEGHEEHDAHSEHADHEDHDDHAHHDEHADHEDHEDHDDHEEHDAHAEHAGHEDHADHAEHAGHDHEHDGLDPHAWLDPQNARIWLDVIATHLAELDPEHADIYAANAAAAKSDLSDLIHDIDHDLDGFRGTSFIVFHDAYQYFEHRFDLSATGSISFGDASDPSPARIAEIRDKVTELDVTCAFSEPQFNPGLIETVFQGTHAEIGVLDPLGADLEPGPDLYPQLLRNLTDHLTSCLE